MFESLALTIADLLRITLPDAYLVLFGLFCAILTKIWLSLSKLHALFFGLVTGLLVYIACVGLAQTPLSNEEGGLLDPTWSEWVIRFGYFMLFAFPIGSVLKEFGSKESAEHHHVILAENILVVSLNVCLLFLLFVGLTESRFIWMGSPLSGVFSEYTWYAEVIQGSQFYTFVLQNTREILLLSIIFYLYKEFFRPIVTLLILSLLTSLHSSVSSLSTALEQKMGKGSSESQSGDHGHDDHHSHENGHDDHSDIVVDNHGQSGHHH